MAAPRRAAHVLLCLLAACKTDRITTVDPSVTAAAEVWSGGVLALRSPSFIDVDSLPIVMVGAETLAVRKVGPDSVQAQVPDTDGLLTVAVRLRAGGRSLVQVRVHGVAAAGAGPALSEPYDAEPQLYPWPGNGNSTALSLDRGRLVLVDLGRNTMTPLTPDSGLGCTRGFLPVPSATGSGLVTVSQQLPGSPNSCGLLAVPAAPSAEPPDTGPGYGNYSAVHLAPGTWLVEQKGYGLSVFTKSPADSFTNTPWLYAYPGLGFTVSPRGDRVVPTQYFYVPGGVPVYDVEAAAPAYVLSLDETWAAAFTPGGDTLFVTGDDSSGQKLLLALNATSGLPLGQVSLPSGVASTSAGYSIAVDPGRLWVYVAGLTPNGPYVDVFDRATWSRAGTLRASASMLRGFDLQSSWYDLSPTLVLNPVTRRLYLAFMSVPTYVFEFDLMP